MVLDDIGMVQALEYVDFLHCFLQSNFLTYGDFLPLKNSKGSFWLQILLHSICFDSDNRYPMLPFLFHSKSHNFRSHSSMRLKSSSLFFIYSKLLSNCIIIISLYLGSWLYLFLFAGQWVFHPCFIFFINISATQLTSFPSF